MTSLWYVGISLQIIASASGTTGKQLIRLSELKNTKDQRALSKTLFALGIFVNVIVGPVIDLASYSFAAQSLVAPFGGLDIVWNTALAPIILQERLSHGRIVGCLLVMIGATLAGAFGNHNEPEYTIEYLEETFVNMRILIYALVFFAWFLVNRLYLMRFPKGSIIRGLSLGCTAGTLAGNMFCAKAAVELVQRSIHEQEAEIWLHWMPYVMALGMIFFSLYNVRFMTQGMLEFEALFMVTVYEGSMIVSGCVSGAVVLLDQKGMEPWRAGLFWLGVLSIAGGMCRIFVEEARRKSAVMAPEQPPVEQPPAEQDVEKCAEEAGADDDDKPISPDDLGIQISFPETCSTNTTEPQPRQQGASVVAEGDCVLGKRATSPVVSSKMMAL